VKGYPEVVMDRIGFYVEGKYFAGRSAQAISFAQFRANEYGRSVIVQFVDHDKSVRIVNTIEQQQKVA
jgi:hypothetical protein